jgi:hypothetical protein
MAHSTTVPAAGIFITTTGTSRAECWLVAASAFFTCTAATTTARIGPTEQNLYTASCGHEQSGER